MTHGGKRPGAGRKEDVPGGRPHQVVVRLSEAEQALLDQLCEQYDLSPSEAIRKAIVLAARQSEP